MNRSTWLPWLCILALVLLLLLPGVLMLQVQFNNAPEVYIPPDAPSMQLERELRREFPNDQALIALFEGDHLYSAEFLAALHAAAQRLVPHPLIERVLAVTTVDHISASFDGFSVEPLIDPRALDETTPEQRRQRVIEDRFASGMLAAADGSALALVVRPVPLDGSLQRLELETALRQAVEAAGIRDSMTAVAGHIALDVAELHSMLRDNARFVPLTVVLGWVLLWLMFRRPLAMVLGGLAMAAASGATVSLLILADRPFTLVSTILPPLISALTLALVIHFYNALALFAQRGLQGPQRVARAVREIRRPARFTALTTAAGLASLGLSPIPPIATFGLVAAVGMFIVYGVIIGLLPPLFARWDRRSWPIGRTGMVWMGIVVDKLAVLGIRYPRWVIGVTVAAIGLGLPMIWRVQAETDLFRFFTADHPIIVSTERVEDELSGVTSLQVVFDGEGRDALKDPERLAAIEAFQDWVETLPEVDRSLSLADFVEEMHWAFHEEDPDYRRIPDSRELISQYLFIYDGRDLYDVVNREFQRALVNLSVNVHPAKEIAAVMAQIRDYLNAAQLHGLQWQIGGSGRLFADQHDLLITGQVRSLWGALILIFGLMWLFWRSLGATFLCMIPNLAPVLLIFIVMGTFGIWLDMATAMIASVVVGIAVDDTIHFYHGYAHRVAAGARPVWALARTYRQAGRAVMATTFVLSVQFLLLVTSQFQPTRFFGLLATLGLVAALFFDLVLLPAILMVMWRRKAGSQAVRGKGPLEKAGSKLSSPDG